MNISLPTTSRHKKVGSTSREMGTMRFRFCVGDKHPYLQLKMSGKGFIYSRHIATVPPWPPLYSPCIYIFVNTTHIYIYRYVVYLQEYVHKYIIRNMYIDINV